MLIFDKGLRIGFFNDRSQRTEGIIKHKSHLEEDAYVVSIFESGNITLVHEDQITHVLVRNVFGNNCWVKFDDLYKMFPDGFTIRPDEKYNIDLEFSMAELPIGPQVSLSPIRSNFLKYVIHDEEVTKAAMLEWKLTPKKVIFNGPATVVMWRDGTKTVVKKTEEDTDDREKAVMFAILKKACGSRGNMNRYLNKFKEDKSNEEKKEEAGGSELCQCEQGTGENSSESTV